MFTYSIPSFTHLLHSGLLGVTQAEIPQRCPLQTVFQPSDLGHLLAWIVSVALKPIPQLISQDK